MQSGLVYIDTVPKEGYRFIVPVRVVETGRGSSIEEGNIAEAGTVAAARIEQQN